MYSINSFNRIVIIADNYSGNENEKSILSKNLNRSTAKNVNSLKQGLETIFAEVIVYDAPSLLLKNIKYHKNDIIFPYWYGYTTRNKQALLASVCEMENMVYVGPDTYSNIVCCDKILSKDICRLNGVLYPRYVVLNSESDTINWQHGFPVIVKPIYEGSSTGINQSNIQYDIEGAKKIAFALLKKLNQPILIEEFIPGKEVNIAIVGWGRNVKVWSAGERYHEKEKDFFDRNLFGFEEKILGNEIAIRDAKSLISLEMKKGFFKLFEWLDKMEYLRIDGKIYNNKFYCFELTNDPSFKPNGSFLSLLKFAGLDYEQSLSLLVSNCLERYNNQLPNQQ